MELCQARTAVAEIYPVVVVPEIDFRAESGQRTVALLHNAVHFAFGGLRQQSRHVTGPLLKR
jgi:hypothetical protein